MKKLDRTGESIFINGVELVIVEYRGTREVIVEFQDEHKYRCTIHYDQFKKQIVKNPFSRSVFGVGYLGVKKDGTVPSVKENYRAYTVWRHMINRCQNKKSYAKVSVCDKWHCFANFVEDIKKLEGYQKWLANEGDYTLDKDILQPNFEYKTYSPKTCLFVTRKENVQEMLKRVHEKEVA